MLSLPYTHRTPYRLMILKISYAHPKGRHLRKNPVQVTNPATSEKGWIYTANVANKP